MGTRLLFLGDVFLTRTCAVNLPGGYPLILNLEGPISNRGTPIEGKINLIMREGILEKVFNPLPVAVSLANNHIMDFGNEAFEDTIMNLEKLGVLFFGAGRANKNYNNPSIVSFEGLRVGFLGYCYAFYYDQIKNVRGLLYGPAPLETERIQRDIDYLKGKVDRIVLTFHWGVEDCNLPEMEQVYFARKVIEMGADCIIGHHAHAIQPVEMHQRGIIAYGLGNFISPDLNVLSYFDEAGKPTECFRKRQRSWNKASVGILIDLAALAYDILPFYFDDRRVENKQKIFHRYATYDIECNLKKLNSLALRNLKWNRLVHCVLSYMEKPKIPTAKRVSAFLKLFTYRKDTAKSWFR